MRISIWSLRCSIKWNQHGDDMSTEVETLAAVELFFTSLEQEAAIRFKNPEDQYKHVMITVREYLRESRLNFRQLRMMRYRINQINFRIEHHYEDQKIFVTTGVEQKGPTAGSADT